MGLDKNTVLIKGIKINTKDIKDMGFDGIYDEKLIPCIEGDSVVSLYHGEGSDDIYIGIEIACSGKYELESVEVKIPDKLKARNELVRLGFSIDIKNVKTYFFDYYS